MERTVTKKNAIRIIRGKPMPKSLEKGFVHNGWEAHLDGVYARTAALFADHAGCSKALYTHLELLLPCIAFYEAAQKVTGSKEKALAFCDEWAFREIEKMMPMARGIMKLGLYRLMPDFGRLMLNNIFGEAAGFRSREVPGGKKISVDMTRCPYYETCKKYGCPELTQYFCKSDDIIYGNLHPKLIWARTQTLGMGGECCDFRLHLKEE